MSLYDLSPFLHLLCMINCDIHYHDIMTYVILCILIIIIHIINMYNMYKTCLSLELSSIVHP